MIDTKELRRLAQAATPGPWYVGTGTYECRNIYSAAAFTDDEGFTYQLLVANAEDDGINCWDANAHLIAAANPAAIVELLDRLEAVRREHLFNEQRIADLMAELNSVDHENAELRAKISDLTINVEYLDNLKKSYEELIGELQDERDALRAKITEMERREVGFRERCTPSSPTGYSNRFPLYALPGAKGE